MLTIIIFLLILSVLVMLHELGHFLMAKRAGIGVEEFGFGLPPRIWGKKIKGTIYSVNWLPFGGFVRLVGEEADDKRRNAKNSFGVKSLPSRMLVVVAGVFANFLIAVLAFYIVVYALGFRVPFSSPVPISYEFKFVDRSTNAVVVDVSEGSPAQSAGIVPGDLIESIDLQKINSIDDLQKIVRAAEGKNLSLRLADFESGNRREVVVVPVYNDKLGVVALGVGLDTVDILNYRTFFQKALAGFIHSYNLLGFSIVSFGHIIGMALDQGTIKPVADTVSGPIGIARATSLFVSEGVLSTIAFAGLLSLNLAFLNILPFPALDGGRFFFLIIEMITRKKLHPKFEKAANTVGFALLLALIILVSFNDILKLIRGTPF